jgi:hypothetical protein
MAKTKHQQGLCTMKGCKAKVSGHHAHCDDHREREFLAGPSRKTFAQRQAERARLAEELRRQAQ